MQSPKLVKQDLKPRLHFQRFEFKYYLPFEMIEPVTQELLKYMKWDPYVADDPKHYYEVVSLYYDSPSLTCYYEKLDGMVSRKKIRCRAYTNSSGERSDHFYEIKRKHDMVVMKDRMQGLRVNLLETIQQIDDDDQLTREMYMDLIYRHLIPQVIVSYHRTPLVGSHEDRLRVTIDSDIWAANPNGETLDADEWLPVLTNGALLEIKYNNVLPFWLALIIQRYDLSRIAYSKYCKSIEKIKGMEPA